MAFQWVFDKCETIALDSKEIVSVSETRNKTIRAVSRGATPRTYIVSMPKYMRYSEVEAEIAAVYAADRFTPETITFDQTFMTDFLDSTLIVDSSTVDVLAYQIPTFNIVARDVVEWDGPFVFVETLL